MQWNKKQADSYQTAHCNNNWYLSILLTISTPTHKQTNTQMNKEYMREEVRGAASNSSEVQQFPCMRRNKESTNTPYYHNILKFPSFLHSPFARPFTFLSCILSPSRASLPSLTRLASPYLRCHHCERVLHGRVLLHPP